MPVMSSIESLFCRSALWRVTARRAVLPWATAGWDFSGRVLEIGAGSGAMALEVTSAFPNARLTVTDLDPAMVAAARAALGDHPDVVVQQADVTALPFDDGAFDMVTSYLMLHHVIHWEAALIEAARVLAPGGALLGYDLTDTVVARLIHRADRSPYLTLSEPDLRSGLAAAGLTAVTTEEGLGGHLVRFRAQKPALDSAP